MFNFKGYKIKEFLPGWLVGTVLTAIVAFILGLLFLCFILFKYFYAKALTLGSEMKTWDAAILAACIAALISIIIKLAESIINTKKRTYYFEKRMSTYETIVSFIFKYQTREGYDPQFTKEEAQQAFFLVSQQVLLWSSIDVQRQWTKYLAKSWNQNNNSYQETVIELFSAITKEIGQKLKRDSLCDNPLLSLLYDQPHYKYSCTNSLTGQTIELEVKSAYCIKK